MAKKSIYILAVVGVLLLGVGVWLSFGLGTGSNSETTEVTIPEGNPAIYEKLDYVMRGEFSYLYIWEDGNVLYIEEKGLRIPSSQNPPTRTWKTAKLTSAQLDNLLAYLENSGLGNLTETYYQFAGQPIEPSGFTMGDMGFNLIVNYGNLSKKVTAYGYLTPDQGETYPDMPSPLNDIYVKLRAIALSTNEVAKENISSPLT